MRANRQRGFVLLEIIISIALFSLVATSMVVALDRLAKTSTMAQVESRIFRRMDSVMTEVCFRPGNRIKIGKTRLPADATGVSVEVLVKPADLVSIEGTALKHMYKVRIRGRLEGSREPVRDLERLVYLPPVGNRTLSGR
ncbi:MAG: type II secretion system protein [Verrucomicrobiales bacterium]|nr:type II secretion system protein [Verrucomicrobiales bacterium]